MSCQDPFASRAPRALKLNPSPPKQPPQEVELDNPKPSHGMKEELLQRPAIAEMTLDTEGMRANQRSHVGQALARHPHRDLRALSTLRDTHQPAYLCKALGICLSTVHLSSTKLS